MSVVFTLRYAPAAKRTEALIEVMIFRNLQICFWVLQFSGLLIWVRVLSIFNFFPGNHKDLRFSSKSKVFGMFADCLCRATVLIFAEMGKIWFLNERLEIVITGNHSCDRKKVNYLILISICVKLYG